MLSNHEGASPLMTVASIAASGSAEFGAINLRGLSAICVTGRVTYNASASGAVTVNLYFSPDGKKWDTIAFGSKALTVSAGDVVQASVIVSVPDSGWLRIVMSNADSTYTATSASVWMVAITQFIEDRQTTPAT